MRIFTDINISKERGDYQAHHILQVLFLVKLGEMGVGLNIHSQKRRFTCGHWIWDVCMVGSLHRGFGPLKRGEMGWVLRFYWGFDLGDRPR
jgi:hypothetical protein